MYRTIRALTLVCLMVPAAFAQETSTTKPAATPADASAKPSLLQRVLDADDKSRPDALVELIEDQIASNAIYAGQYAGLLKVKEPAAKLLQDWLIEPPISIDDDIAFRTACIRAMRDLVEDEAPEDLMDTLKEIIQDEFEEDPIKLAAIYALAQFGDRRIVDVQIKRATQMTKSEDVTQRGTGFNLLADTYYNIRDYGKAVENYQARIELLEANDTLGNPTLYYNCGCSMALAGKIDDAFAMVEKGLALGAKANRPLPQRLLMTDMDIAALRQDEARFAALIDKFYGSGGAAKKADEKAVDQAKSKAGEAGK